MVDLPYLASLQLIAALTDHASVSRYLEGVGLPARSPPIARGRPQAQTDSMQKAKATPDGATFASLDPHIGVGGMTAAFGCG